jgi:hypothetical protein
VELSKTEATIGRLSQQPSITSGPPPDFTSSQESLTRSFGVGWKTDDGGKHLNYEVYREQDINKNTSVERLPGRPMMRH